MADPIITPAADAAIASGAGKTSFWAAITSGASGLVGGIDWISTGGFLIALCSLCVSWYFKRGQAQRDLEFKRREDERQDKAADDAHAEHLARMRQMELESQMSRAVGVSSQVDE